MNLYEDSTIAHFNFALEVYLYNLINRNLIGDQKEKQQVKNQLDKIKKRKNQKELNKKCNKKYKKKKKNYKDQMVKLNNKNLQ